MAISACSNTLDNTGKVKCAPILAEDEQLIFVPTFAADGTVNKIANTAVFTQNAMQALIDQADATKRWYPVGTIEEVSDERAESSFWTAASGRRYKAKKGTRTYRFELANAWGLDMKAFEKFECTEMSFFKVDANKGLVGMNKDTDDGYTYPIRIAKDSMDTIFMPPTPTTPPRIQVSFEIDSREKDSNLRMFEYDTNVMTADPSAAEGLVNVSATYSSITTTSFVVDLYAVHSGVNRKIAITGLLITDFFDVRGGTHSKVYNVTDSSAVTISSFAESATVPGRYTIGYTAQTSADVLRVTPVKTQLDFTAVVASTVLIP
jgi:hypothetical protein